LSDSSVILKRQISLQEDSTIKEENIAKPVQINLQEILQGAIMKISLNKVSLKTLITSTIVQILLRTKSNYFHLNFRIRGMALDKYCSR
jgi:hypothetical protein